MKRSLVLLLVLIGLSYSYRVNTGGLSGLVQSPSAITLGKGSLNAGVTLKGDYAPEGILYQDQNGKYHFTDPAMYTQDFFFGYGVLDWLDLAINFPIYQDIVSQFEDGAAVGVGDLSTSIKIIHPGLKSDALLYVAYLFRVSFPTGTTDKGYFPRSAHYAFQEAENEFAPYSSTGINLNPMLIWTMDFTRLSKPKPFKIYGNAGIDGLFDSSKKPNVQSDFITALGSIGFEYIKSPSLSFFSEIYGTTRARNLSEGFRKEILIEDKFDISIGVTYKHTTGLYSSFALNGNLGRKNNDLDWTVVRYNDTVRYSTQSSPQFGFTWTLGYGMVGKNADSDFDNNPASTDKCPFKAEDYDGYEDDDGCPDLVHSADTVTVIQKDTIVIYKTDTVSVVQQQAPERIIQFGQTAFPRITFQLGKAILKPSSFKTLNDIAKSLKNYPDVKLEVLGYTDNTGSPKKNQVLSQQRAQAVIDYLVKSGVEVTRLKAIGKGESNPIETNKTIEGRVLNRRVEFKRTK